MDADRIERALARISAAASRIEAAAAQPGDGDKMLARKHAELRECVSASLGELDELIGELED